MGFQPGYFFRHLVVAFLLQRHVMFPREGGVLKVVKGQLSEEPALHLLLSIPVCFCVSCLFCILLFRQCLASAVVC